MFAVSCDALFAAVLLAHHLATAVVLAAEDGTALKFASVRTFFFVALSKTTLHPHLLLLMQLVHLLHARHAWLHHLWVHGL